MPMLDLMPNITFASATLSPQTLSRLISLIPVVVAILAAAILVVRIREQGQRSAM